MVARRVALVGVSALGLLATAVAGLGAIVAMRLRRRRA